MQVKKEMKQSTIVIKKFEQDNYFVLLTQKHGKIAARLKQSSLAKQLHAGMLFHGVIEKKGKYYSVDSVDLVAVPHFASLESMEQFHDVLRLVLHVLPEQAVDDDIFRLVSHAILYWHIMNGVDQQLTVAKLFFLVDLFPEHIASYQLVFNSAQKDEVEVVSLLRTCWQLYDQR